MFRTFSRLSYIVLFVFCAAGIAAAPAVGARVPDFTLPIVGGARDFHLDDSISKSRFIVLMFVATRCPYSNAYNQRMSKFPARYGSDVQFIGINSNKTEATSEIIEHARANGLGFPILKDEGNKVADLYDARKTPEIYVLDSNGVLKYHGRIDDSKEESDVKSTDLDDALNALLAGKPVRQAITKAFGCSIKRV